MIYGLFTDFRVFFICACRYFVLRIIDILLTKLIPELENEKFQKQLARLRTLNPPPTIRFSARPT